jgi:hypothetical protein
LLAAVATVAAASAQAQDAPIAQELVPEVAAAAAATADVSPAFGNTLITTMEGGPETRWLLREGGAYDVIRADGSRATGRWAVEGADVCLTAESGQRACLPLLPPGASVGQSWTVDTGAGRTLQVSLVAGQN